MIQKIHTMKNFTLLFIFISFFVLTNETTAQISNVAISSPNGGEVLTRGSWHMIKWSVLSSSVYNTVIIEYSVDNGVNWIRIDSLSSNGNYNWKVPANYSTQCLVKVALKSGSDVDISDAVFTIAQGTAAGIEDENKEKTFTVYPNPASSIIKLNLQASVKKIEVFDITGKAIITIDSKEIESYNILQQGINIESFSSGVYFLSVTNTDNIVSTQKLIVE